MGLRSVRSASNSASNQLSRVAASEDDAADCSPEIESRQQVAEVMSSSPPRAVDLFGSAPLLPVAVAASSIELPLMSTKQKTTALATLNENEVRGCVKCRLSETRTQTVFGEGDVDAKIFFVGEGPGENEDLTGRPFVGRAGQLLDKMIGAMGLSRSQVFIANIVKCRPPNNRVPAPDEVETCTPYLVRQLEIIRPRAIVTLGLPAVKYMLGDPKLTMGRTRGTWQSWRGIKLMPTYHPSYVLRAYTEANRAAVWSDLQMVMKEVGMPSKAKPKS
jgi:uracil-DNA glycosylase